MRLIVFRESLQLAQWRCTDRHRDFASTKFPIYQFVSSEVSLISRADVETTLVIRPRDFCYVHFTNGIRTLFELIRLCFAARGTRTD